MKKQKLLSAFAILSALSALSTLMFATPASALDSRDSTPSVSGIFDLSSLDMIQALLGVGGTQGTFQIGLGGLYKRTIAGTHAFGLHVGGGLAYENVSIAANGGSGNNTFIITGVAGIHARFPGLERIALHFDAGPSLSLFNSTSNFTLGALSSALGLSVVYYL
jgi:hypothetical protein